MIKFLKNQDELEIHYFDILLCTIGSILFGIFGREISAVKFIAVLLLSICGLYGLVYLHNSLIRLSKTL